MTVTSLRTRVKICGITRPEDGVEAARLGADAIGLVFYAPSPRAVTIAQAQKIVRALPPWVSVVALFVDASPQTVWTVLEQVSVDVLQFHGDEPPSTCSQFARPYIKALHMRPEMNLNAAVAHYHEAQGLLLDAYQPGVPGGTGVTFDWSRVPQDSAKPFILAGGLTPENVADAICAARPYAVDVSGGVESRKGIKDAAKMSAFMRAVAGTPA